jgi:DNA-binding GntR family transcriptional regulator
MPPLTQRSLSETIVDSLRESIETGEFPPGHRLVERHLAGEFGVSHIPVREALARLEDEGLVTRLPRRGARVASVSHRDLVEISSVRSVLEQLVVQLAIQQATPETLARLDAIAGEMVAQARAGAAEEVARLDREFHHALWQLADHELLLELAHQMRGRINRFLLAATLERSPSELVTHAETHQHLAKLIADGDVPAAKAAMEEHIAGAMQHIERHASPVAA